MPRVNTRPFSRPECSHCHSLFLLIYHKMAKRVIHTQINLPIVKRLELGWGFPNACGMWYCMAEHWSSADGLTQNRP